MNKQKRPTDKKCQSSANEQGHFNGTANRRQLRVIQALMVGSRSREEIDHIAGCSNGPELIAALRRSGLEIPCVRIPALDLDGAEVSRGVYYLTARDRRKVACCIRAR